MMAGSTRVCDIGVAGDEAVIAVVGPLDPAELLTAVDAVLGEAVGAVEIDLRHCDVVGLTGARALEAVAASCAEEGVDCEVVGADPFVRHLVDGVGLDVPLR